MNKHRPQTRTLGVTEARQQFSSLLNQVFGGEERVIVEKNGIPVAALVSARDLDRLEQFEEKWERGFEVFDEIGAAFADVPLDELEREVARAVRQARKELREERTQAASRP